MRKFLFPLVLFLFASWFTNVYAQKEGSEIVGYYLAKDDETEEEKSQIYIFKAKNGKYYGNIVWLRDPLENGNPKVDDKNPDESKQSRPLMNLQILQGFEYDAKRNEWRNGTIYSPTSGKLYKCFMRFEEENKLMVKGYVGKQWMGLGKTVYWKKEKSKR